MKKLLTMFPAVMLLVFMQLFTAQNANAQGDPGTDDDGFLVQINTPASIAQVLKNGPQAGDCYWEGSTYGPDVTAPFCGQVVWAKDSLGCSTITNDLTGKIALIRRGTCNFSIKVYNAMKAGATAAIIVTHYSNTAESSCALALSGMSGTDTFAAAVTIPSIIICRQTGEQIDGALAAGEEVNVCFQFPRMSSPTAASMYATPLSQVTPMQAITVVYNNRSGATQTDVNLKAEFIDPSGALTGSVTYNAPVVEPGVDSFIIFPPYDAPPAKGKHKVLFTNDKYHESIDSVYAYFEHTDYTFATDNLVNDPGGVGPANADFINANFFIQSGGLCLTGDTEAKVTYATFGISNIDSVYTPGNPGANLIGIYVYSADPDGDGAGNLSSSFADDLGTGIVSYAEYTMDGTEINDNLISVPLTDFNTGAPGVTLDPNAAYYVSLVYDGTAAGTGRCIRFRNSTDVGYASFTGYPTTPLYFGSLFTGGWSGAIVAERLEMEGFTPPVAVKEPKVLDASKIAITPNPANDVVRLKIDLNEVSPTVAVSIIEPSGKLAVATQIEKNFQSGEMTFNVSNLPSGTYLVWVRTAEGSTMKPVAVCH